MPDVAAQSLSHPTRFNVRARLIDNRPPVTSLPVDQLLYELLFQITLCGGVIDPAARKPTAKSSANFIASWSNVCIRKRLPWAIR
ncbi:MAG: hypothetical protein U0Y68_01655 [Blastocatellia bacterium]